MFRSPTGLGSEGSGEGASVLRPGPSTSSGPEVQSRKVVSSRDTLHPLGPSEGGGLRSRAGGHLPWRLETWAQVLKRFGSLETLRVSFAERLRPASLGCAPSNYP